ncbi:armadillo repeat-containing protein gudu isoform X2 [Bacillus rossius redtenbacheri]|uniref:armadillo repeat-containing protein gudu isoform X2 n=2 Tax=Bacillus rossius redtenbacheri TaxID=93214 RepID=UPI002FDDAFF5
MTAEARGGDPQQLQLQLGPRVVVIADLDDDSDSSPSEEEQPRWTAAARSTQLPAEYWNIQKLVRYMKAGNQTATVLALCCLKDHDLTTEVNQMAIRDIGGLEVLVNLLETNDPKCMLGALSVLSEVSDNAEVRRGVTDLGGVPLLVGMLSLPSRDLQLLAAQTIAHVARVRKARKYVRRFGGIPKLVDLLDVRRAALVTPVDELQPDDRPQVLVARAGAQALWSLSQSARNRDAMRRAGVMRLLAALIQSVHLDVVVPIMGTLQQCASESKYQLGIRTEGMIPDLVRHLSTDNMELKKHCASAIFKCAEDEQTRALVRQSGGLDPLVALAKSPAAAADKPLLAAVTGAIWKCARCPDNVRRLDELGAVSALVALLADESEEVLTNVVGALAECCKFPDNRAALLSHDGIPPLVALLNGTNPALLRNVALVLGECSHEMDSIEVIDKLDGIRLLWSLLKNPDTEVQANAAWALCPCIQNAKNAGEMVRSFVGGLELIVSLLGSDDTRVLACVSAAIAVIALDRENLAVVTDHGMVPMLARLVLTDEDRLRQHLAEAIANCCGWKDNCRELGRLGAIPPLVSYMTSRDGGVHRATARALFQLSADPFNCTAMHRSGVVKYLLETIGSPDEKLQEASAGCLSNIRKLALSADRFKYSA